MEILTSGQRRLLQAFGEVDFFRSNFVMTGGTALAAFYLEHRPCLACEGAEPGAAEFLLAIDGRDNAG